MECSVALLVEPTVPQISGSRFSDVICPVSNGTYSDLLSELWTQGMTGSDAAEASGDNVWTWTVGSGGAGSWSVVVI